MDPYTHGQPIDRGDRTESGPDGTPLLSIGLAVYNGARYLRSAIDSLLAQDVGDLELVISDNASTDETPLICTEYAERDPRVRFTRNASNIGAAANFNQVFESSAGRYFMWGSDDDVWDPRFASSCISELEREPAAVMCTSRVGLIDEHGRRREAEWYRSLDTRGMSVEARVHQLVAQRSWYGMYAVFRPSALRRTRLYRPVFGGDVHLLLELLLLGDALAVPEELLLYRLPTDSKSALDSIVEIRGSMGELDDRLEAERPWSGLASALLRIVEESGLDRATVDRIREDIVETLSVDNTSWSNAILAEYGGVLPGVTPLPGSILRVAVEAALSDAPAPSEARQLPWRVREGMRLTRLRRLILRLLQPFTDGQQRLDAEQTAAISLLADQVRALQRRVEELEVSSPEAPDRMRGRER